MTNITPKKISIYYSYPSLVNSSGGNIAQAVAVFSQYDLVVFGSGLELSTHSDHSNTISIITDSGMANTSVFGYIDATLSLSEIQDKIDLWAAMSVKGIFCDQFGYDYGITRSKQKDIILYIHNANLKGFVNAWNPDDVFSPSVNTTYNPSGLATSMSNQDWYLAESFAVNQGSYDDTDSDSNGIKDFQEKAIKMSSYATTYGSNMAAIATLGAATFVQNFADYSYFAAVLNSMTAWGFAEQYYSAASASLPYRTRMNFHGNKFTSAISTSGGKLEHQTNIGIHVDTNAHTVSVLLD